MLCVKVQGSVWVDVCMCRIDVGRRQELVFSEFSHKYLNFVDVGRIVDISWGSGVG